MKLYDQIEVDLYNPFPLPVLNAAQNNIGRGALVTLKSGASIVVPTDESLTFYAARPDGTVSFLDATLTDNAVQIDFSNQMLSVSGQVQVEIRMVSGTGEDLTDITTPIFVVEVLPSNIDDSAVESTNEFTALETALAEVEELKKNGLKGDPGDAATITVGTVTASGPGSAPQVTNSGTENAAILDFVLPRGEQGDAGAVVIEAYADFPATGAANTLYVDSSVTPAKAYIWNGGAYVLAGGEEQIVADAYANFPTTGEEGVLYIATDTNLLYRWTGSAYEQVGGKETEILDATVTLSASAWTGTESPYTQTVTVTGMTADKAAVYALMTEEVIATDTENENYGLIVGVEQGADTVTFYASAIPSADVTIRIF